MEQAFCSAACDACMRARKGVDHRLRLLLLIYAAPQFLSDDDHGPQILPHFLFSCSLNRHLTAFFLCQSTKTTAMKHKRQRDNEETI